MMRAVILLRVSTTKQAKSQGDTLAQLSVCKSFVEKMHWEIVDILTVIESGHDNARTHFQDVIDYCLDKSNKVDVLVFKDISRFTRDGPTAFQHLKEELEKAGIAIQDTEGVIR